MEQYPLGRNWQLIYVQKFQSLFSNSLSDVFLVNIVKNKKLIQPTLKVKSVIKC